MNHFFSSRTARSVAIAAGFFVIPLVALAASTELINPITSSTICGLLRSLLSAFLNIGIPVAVLFLVYAGFLFIMAQGNPGKIIKARQNLMYTTMGIALFLGAWLMGQVIASTINSLTATTGNGGQPAIGSCR